MRERKERCDKCKWWEPLDLDEVDPELGWCQRYPPCFPSEAMRSLMRDETSTHTKDEGSWFPVMTPYEFCGEFTTKGEAI